LRGRASDEIPLMLRESLIAEGVSGNAIEVIPEEQRAIQRALGMAKRDDWLLIFVDAIGRSWKQIQDYQSDEAVTGSAEHHPPSEVDLGTFAGFSDFDFDSSVELVQDERGVRIVSQEESD